MLAQTFTILALTLAGGLGATLLAVLPFGSSIHICSLLLLILTNLSFTSMLSTPVAIALTVAVAVGYTIGSTIPALVFQCTDESSLYLPPLGNRVAADGQLHHAVMYTGLGSLGAIIVLLLLTPFASNLIGRLLPLAQSWQNPLLSLALIILLASLVFDSWRASHTGRGSETNRLGAGLVTVLLSGIAGLVLYFKPLGHTQLAAMNQTPLFLGLWIVPWLIKSLNSRAKELPEQPPTKELPVDTKRTIYAIISGSLVGFLCLLAAIVSPCAMAVCGWVLMRRERRLQLIGQAAARTMLIVGGTVMAFLPISHNPNSHFGWFFQGGQTSFITGDYLVAICAMLIAATAAFLLLSPVATMAIKFAARVPRFLVPAIAGALMILSCGLFFGWYGLLVLLVSSAIGGFCLAYGGRRTSCLGAVLIPALCQWLNLTDAIRQILSL